jgi:peptide deformylase
VSEREIRIFGDPVLKTICREVVELESVNQLVENLLDTCSIPGRAGVAANQIGVDLRVFSYRVDGELGYLINPVITDFSEETELMEEGCLSVPGLWKTVLRSTSVGVKGSQLDGSEIAIQAEGLLAQVFQHECDHLDGVLYIDRLDKESKKTAMSEIRNSDWFL